MKIAVAQMGARMHYAVPRILEREGLLERLFTDCCAIKGWPRLLHAIPRQLRTGRLERLLTRVPKGVASERTTAFNLFGLQYAMMLARAGSDAERDEVFLWAGEKFAGMIKREGLGNARSVYCFNTAGVEIFQHATQQGIRRIHEQTISPRRIEQSLMEEERDAFPAWGGVSHSPGASVLADREAEEWKAADLILCASDYVRDGIAACGGDVTKCQVVPYGIDHPAGPVVRPARPSGPLRVLTVGSVGLRKGSPYVMAAAKLLKGLAEFRIVGPLHCSEAARLELRKHLHLTGPVPRSAISGHYAWADVFLLPSLCEGSATSTYEAMFHGLPVICTAHTGSIVRDGLDGYIVPARSPEAVAGKLIALAASPELLATLSEAAIQRASEFTLQHYAARLLAALAQNGIAAAAD